MKPNRTFPLGALIITAIAIGISGCFTQRSATIAGGPLGKVLLQEKGCLACHSVNGQPGVGPTFFKLAGKTETLVGGAQVLVDAAYLKESIRLPAAKVVQGFPPSMPAVPLTDTELDTIVAYLQTL